ncbi:hypothetical protein WJX81_003554 [Elliptochloris bilobata]|uniref:GB1/RHD3-type G domain-containing protein n=1 Tax=Elliptochloris bilobata TaxID=381761 RepID=A0AAW1QWG8_9CHLO
MSVNGPVGVVSVCGRARQGKSYILNQLLGQSSGFVVAPTHRPCTKGLWMWSSPVERLSPDGSKYHLVLLDTEGIDAYDQTGQYSTQIFSLAVLLSSLFVYNQMGGIDEAALDRLSLVTEVTKHVRVRAGSSAGEGEENELANFTPAFLWLLRDFYLTLEEDGRQLTPREYLETALRPVAGSGRAVEAKNAIRASITALFPNRDCFSLVRPMSDERALQRLETVPAAQLRPEFREGLARLTRVIFARAQPKRLGSQTITGSMLAALAEAYVLAINRGAVPTIATAWQGVAEAECRRAADAAEAAYRANFNRGVPAEEGRLDAEHARCLALAASTFASTAIGEPAVREANAARWRERCEREFQALRKERLASAELECQKLVNAAAAHLTQVAAREDATVELLQRELGAWEARYRASPAAAGAAKWRLHADFVSGPFAAMVTGVAARQEAAARQRAADAERRAEQAEARHAERERAAAARAAEHERAATAAYGQVQGLQQQLAAATAAADAARRGEAAARQAASAAQAELAALRQQASAAGADSERWASEALGAAQARAAAAAERDSAVADVRAAAAALASERTARAAAEARATEAATRASDAERRLAAAEAAQRDVATRLAGAEAEARAAQQRVPEASAMEADGAPSPAVGSAPGAFDPAKKTIAELKAWLTEQGEEDQVWDLNVRKAKKPEYVAAAQALLSRS